MLEILTLIAPATITALLAPIILEWFRKSLTAKKERRKQNLDEDKYNDQLAHDLREELREENRTLKQSNAQLQDKVNAASVAMTEVENWKRKFYALKKEKAALEFELSLLKKELEYLRSTYEEYHSIRERAEHIGDDDEPQ